jgi:putative PIN family toxin of toxin-antitoxin system
MKAEGDLPPEYARVVVDTNVLLSAALAPRSAPAALVDRVLLAGRLVFSQTTFAEFETRIWKPKFDRHLSVEIRRRLLRDFNASALWVEPTHEVASQAFSRDRSDDPFIHAALAADARRLITGDDDLLRLHPLGELQILTPRAALDELGRSGEERG